MYVPMSTIPATLATLANFKYPTLKWPGTVDRMRTGSKAVLFSISWSFLQPQNKQRRRGMSLVCFTITPSTWRNCNDCSHTQKLLVRLQPSGVIMVSTKGRSSTTRAQPSGPPRNSLRCLIQEYLLRPRGTAIANIRVSPPLRLLSSSVAKLPHLGNNGDLCLTTTERQITHSSHPNNNVGAANGTIRGAGTRLTWRSPRRLSDINTSNQSDLENCGCVCIVNLSSRIRKEDRRWTSG